MEIVVVILEIILGIALFIVISGLVMVATNILYDFAAAIIPAFAIIMIAIGILVGFVVAVKNTVLVYKKVYFKKGE